MIVETQKQLATQVILVELNSCNTLSDSTITL